MHKPSRLTTGLVFASSLFTAAAALSTVTPHQSAQAASQTPADARLGAAADAVVASGVPGVSVYTRRGARVTVLTRGDAVVSTKRPLTPADRFRVGSVTKSFVATVVMQLVREGRLSLDDTVEQHLPGLVPNGSAITLRELLSHTSGLPDYFSNKRIYAPYARGNLTYRWSHRDVVRISAADPALFPPGAPDRFAYSNTGYYVLGLTVEQVTGHSLGAELRRRIFRPLGLAHTSLPSGDLPPAPYAHGYTPAGHALQELTAISPTILWAAGAVVSTPSDVAAFQRALVRGRLLPRALVRTMETPVVTLPGPPAHRQAVGLGLFRVPFPCGTAWGHGGDLPGYTTDAYTSPDGSRQAVIALNAGEESTLPAPARTAIDRLLAAAYCG